MNAAVILQSACYIVIIALYITSHDRQLYLTVSTCHRGFCKQYSLLFGYMLQLLCEPTGEQPGSKYLCEIKRLDMAHSNALDPEYPKWMDCIGERTFIEVGRVYHREIAFQLPFPATVLDDIKELFKLSFLSLSDIQVDNCHLSLLLRLNNNDGRNNHPMAFNG